jgi:hypothetical protein
VYTVRRSGDGIDLVAADNRTVTADRVVSATEFRPDHVRSIVAALAGDFDAAEEAQLNLPKTSVLGSDLAAVAASREIALQIATLTDQPARCPASPG